MSALHVISLLVIGLLIAGCVTFPSISGVTSSGRDETKSYDLDGFTKVNVSSAFTADVARATAYKVEVTVDSSLLDRLDVRVSGDTLYIGLKSGTSIRGAATMRAVVTMPELGGLNLSGATTTTISGFDSNKGLEVTVSGASRLSGDITCGNTRFNVSGASRVELAGAAGDVQANASGASTLALDDFRATDVNVDVSGASRATVNVRGTLDASASGASTVLYTGDPTSVREHTSGASTVRSK